jgi:transketolase
MGLEDLAMLRAVHGSTVLYPCDANQAAKLVVAMADLRGISYIRTTREKTAILYGLDDEFPIGGSRVVRGGGPDDRVTVVAAGITVHESLKALDELAKSGINIRLIDAYSVKPLDARGIAKAVRETGGRLVVVEDHWPEGGLGDAVLAGLVGLGVNGIALRHLAVHEMPSSGKPAELLAAAGIAARDIAAAVRALLA